MLTVVIAFAGVWLLLWGSNSFSAFGATRVDDTIKNISKRNTMSVIDDMLNCAFTFDPRFSAILTIFDY
jgi:hypothetical protein